MADLVAGVVALCPALDADAVKEIIDTDLTDAQINNYINAAYRIAIPLTGELTACGGTDTHCDIIRWLAAHLITVAPSGGAVKSQSVAGEWSVSFLTQGGKGLDASSYGQAVKEMDCSGKLASLGLKAANLAVATYDQLEDLPDED